MRNKQTGEVHTVTPRTREMNKNLWAEMSVLLNESLELKKAVVAHEVVKKAFEAELLNRRDDRSLDNVVWEADGMDQASPGTAIRHRISVLFGWNEIGHRETQ